jgi:hypothetical protein
MSKLAEDLATGEWERRNHLLLSLDTLRLGDRIVIARCA